MLGCVSNPLHALLLTNRANKPVSSWGVLLPSDTETTDTVSVKGLQAEATIQSCTRQLEDLTLLQTKQLVQANEELTRRNSELSALVEMKEEFVCAVSHDLKSPFAAILGFSELLLQDRENPLTNRQRKVMARIGASARDLLALIQNLLDIASLETGKAVIDLSIVWVKPLVELVYRKLSDSFNSKNISFANDIPDNINVYADATWLGEVLKNLIGNALKFTADSGWVRIGVTDHDDYARLSVADSGIGVDPAILPYVFDKHHKTSTRGTHGETGTGFGLPLCKRIIELHNGTIWIESEAHKGTRVCFTLPRVVSAVGSQAAGLPATGLPAVGLLATDLSATDLSAASNRR